MAAPDQDSASKSFTDDAFLGGALRVLQPRKGYRAGIDAVLLAAGIPDTAGRVLDVGAGVGVAGLCVARRITAAHVVLLEREPELARLGAENIRRNDLLGRVRVIEGSVQASGAELAQLGLAPESFEHVMANPPFHALEKGTRSDEPLKDAAHAMGERGLAAWARFFARMSAPGGTATVIHKAEALASILSAFEGKFGALQVLPIHARAGEPAIRVIVRGVKGSRAPLAILPRFVLHGNAQAFTPEAEAILRRGAPLNL